MKKKILIVDDDLFICEVLERLLKNNNYDTAIAGSLKKALEKIKEETYNLILCDYRLPDGEGIEILDYVLEVSPNTQIVIMTAYSEIKTAVNVIKKGALDYITKPIQQDELKKLLSKALNSSEGETNTQRKVKTPKPNSNKRNESLDYVKGRSKQIENIYKMVNLVAPTNLSIIIEGETGVGKEIIAKKIHEESNRCNNPFVALDCGAIPKDLANSELFGHIKGSFTGAISNKTGVFEQAHTGTLFLDEIGNLSYDLQIKLLRTIQDDSILKIGDTHTTKIDVRIISATNENLLSLIEKGEFREDLYHRINEFNIKLPALRERKEDIEEFIEFFIKKANKELNRHVEDIDLETRHILLSYPWHGNIRELKNVITRSVLLCEGNTITRQHIPIDLVNTNELNNNYLKDVSKSAEKQKILETLKQFGNNKTQTAKALNIDRKTLYNKLHLHNIKIT